MARIQVSLNIISVNQDYFNHTLIDLISRIPIIVVISSNHD